MSTTSNEDQEMFRLQTCCVLDLKDQLRYPCVASLSILSPSIAEIALMFTVNLW